MPFILRALELLKFSIPRQFQRAKVVQPGDGALTEHFEEFLWNTVVAIRQVKQIGDGTVGKLQSDGDVIGGILRGVGEACRSDAVNGRTDDSASPVHKMAELAHDAAALGVNPMILRETAGVDAGMDQHWLTAAGEELADFFGERRKPPVEAHHHEGRMASLQLACVYLP